MRVPPNRSVTLFRAPVQWLHPVQLSANALLRLSTDAGTLRRVLETLARLSPDDYLDFMVSYLGHGLERFGAAWGYADLLTVLQGATEALEPETYLEIGVRRGRSLAVVGAARPDATMYGFDLWTPEYAGMPNPGPEFVQSEARRAGHTGPLHLIVGDSHVTVPGFLEQNPELHFDLITVDGDHTAEGARADLRCVLPRLKVGGVLILDDVSHPEHAYLADLWRNEVAADPALDCATYTELGYGVAFAIRRA